MSHGQGDAIRCWCGCTEGAPVHPRYRQCRDCSTACLVAPPSDRTLRDLYSWQGYWHDYQVRDLDFPAIEQRAENDFRDRIPVWHQLLRSAKPGARSLLEIGCAHGGFLAHCRDQGIPDVVGVEVDPETCAFARSRFCLPNVVPGLFPDVTLPRDTFDAIVGFDVLEHIVDPLRALRAVRSLLAEDGVVIFQTPVYSGQTDPQWRHFKAPEHVHLYTPDSARRLLTAAGLWPVCFVPGCFPDDMFVVARRGPVRSIVYLRTDSIGDAVLSAGMLPLLADAYPGAAIHVACQRHLAELYEPCPHVASVVTFDKPRALADEAYRNEVAAAVRGLNADLCLNPVYSRDPLGDVLSASSGATQRIAHAGDMSNTTPEFRQAFDPTYSVLINMPDRRPEVARHHDFLTYLGITTPPAPQVWTTDADRAFAADVFATHGLPPDRTVALFAGAQFAIKDYHRFAEAIAPLCRARGLHVVALGGGREREVNRAALDALGVPAVDLSGRTTLRQAFEVVRRCRVAVGVDTALAHVACAVGVPNVVVLGGGHFGRFLPYSPLTHVACLPLGCFDCNWECRYARPHCVADVHPEVIGHALGAALDHPQGARPRVFAMDASLWPAVPGRPAWGWPHHLLHPASVELYTLGRPQK